MPHNLLVRLIKTPQQPLGMEWAVILDDGRLQLSSEVGGDKNLSSLAEKANNITILVPSEDILFTKVQLPKLSPYRLAKAIPFALEDQLTEDPNDVHFAMGKRIDTEPLPVAVVANDVMQSWQAFIAKKLGKAAVEVNAYIPDVLSLPWEVGTFQIYSDESLALVRTGLSSGFAIEKTQLFPLLQLLLNQSEAQKPNVIQVHDDAVDKLFTKQQISELGVSVAVSAPPENLLSVMSQATHQPIPVNLLQGKFEPARKRASFEQLILASFAIVGVWMLFLTTVNIASVAIIYREQHSIDKSMQSLYSQIIPNESIPSDPRKSLQTTLNKLRASRSDSTFMRLLQMVGVEYEPFRRLGVEIKGATYRNDKMNLEVESKESEALNKLKSAFEDSGLKVEVSQAQRNTKGMIEMQLTVEEVT